MQTPLKEKIDFYYNEQGYMVFTEHYHLQRGYCCGNGCKHCPYAYEKVPEPKRTALLANRHNGEQEK
ncbi:DUF5522 domain-containing protein [Chitinophaga agri]|uniref:Uncharacterized protein n=1 Tax=Chitinophaga agri TaxID=2703787 RepID=A0A6B9ZJE6_9BACT|nr:DUF5522 domain-containing protein [Chitinophaga agri]QHS61919.1 hypothetical protein GWR21_20615 [Chitinophaga agri]